MARCSGATRNRSVETPGGHLEPTGGLVERLRGHLRPGAPLPLRRPRWRRANTVDPRHGQDRRELLTSYTDLLSFSRAATGMSDDQAARLARAAQDHEQEAARVLDRAIRLREAIYRLFGGPGATAADLAGLNDELGQAMSHARVVRTGPSFSWIWPDTDDLARPLWPVARSAAKLLTSPEIERVGECLGGNCGWLFLDTSRNRRRAWCSMQGCGNRAKARRHYARRRTSGR
jgi:predicted RNA-binding Zn ribbon-like protein